MRGADVCPDHGAADHDRGAIFADEIGIEIGIYGQFRLKTAYQPIFARDRSTLNPVAVEGSAALFRDGKPMPEDDFLETVPDADRAFVDSMRRALHQRNFRNIGVPSLGLLFHCGAPVGVSDESADAKMEDLAERLAMMELTPEQMICAISPAMAREAKLLPDLVNVLRGHGFMIALDGFGADDKAFERIDKAQPDIVRTDTTWFQAICADVATARLFAPIARTVRELGSRVLVGAIETPAQLRVAIDGGADYVQGDLLARPALAGTMFDEAPAPLERLFGTGANVVPLFG